MPRRVSLPSADDLFRPTDTDGGAEAAPEPVAPKQSAVRAVPDVGPDVEPSVAAGVGPDAEPEPRRPSGRVRHDEKMTVYVTSAELIDIEQARLTLRGRHGLAVDRGRLVREAVAVVLHDLEEHGDESMLVRRLGEA